MQLEQKYQALLVHAEQRGPSQLDTIRLCFQTLSLASRIDRDCAALLAPHGLSEGRFILLFLLDAAQDGLAPHALAEQAGISRATVTGLVDGLEREALVQRHADPQDRRSLRIQLTTKGEQLAAQVLAQHTRWIGGLFSSLTADERSQLSSLLNKVSEGLQSSQQEATA